MKVAMLLSGGVDSSVAMKLLQEQGYDVTAFYLRIWLEDELAFLGECPWEEDLKFVRAVCAQLNIPLEIVNMQQEYLDTVVEYVITELKAGRTPSPDIMCNLHIKFGKFLSKIPAGFEKVASGHYGQIEEKDGKFYLKESPDKIKDQTYFLTYLKQEQLAKILFPLGPYNKDQIRTMAEEFDLPNKSRKDSQGICFLGKIKYNDFIQFHLGVNPGEIIDIDSGKVLGYHKGYWYHTIGQRQGLGLSGGPWFVAKKDLENNIVYVSKNKHFETVAQDKFILEDINWIPEKPVGEEFEVKLRHGKRKVKCRIEFPFDDVKKAAVTLEQEDQGIAPGQFAIIYRDGYCFGGGRMELIPAYETNLIL